MRALSSTTLLLVALTAPFTTASSVLIGRAEEDGPCTGASNAPGVCVPTGKCTAAGGKFISNACPGTPDDIKCCTKPSCGTGGKGNCRFTNTCSTGKTETDQCPGPATFKCCMPSSSGGGDSGGYPTPDFPSLSSGCKQTAIDGAKKIVNQFPGKIVEIGCKRACSDGDNSQHCNGMATDLMVTKIGSKSDQGEPIAEWVMKNRNSLSLRYVMWGQRIWELGDSEKPWSQWKYQQCTVIKNCKNGDRGDNTANHWDHVHVSYN